MRILVIRLGKAEEVLFSTPIVRTLKAQHPDAELHYLTQPEYTDLLTENPYLSSVMAYAGPTLPGPQPYDIIIDLEGTPAVGRMLKQHRGAAYRFKRLPWANWLLTNFQRNTLPNRHLTDRFFEVVSPLNIKADTLGLDFFIPEQDNVPLNWLPDLPANGDYVVFLLSADYTTRQLPLNRMIELCDKMNKPVLLLGNTEDNSKAQAITDFFNLPGNAKYEEGLSQLGKRTRMINGCGKFNLNQQASLIKQARYVFCHDGIHLAIASAFQKQIFSIWGNTIPEMGKYPYRTRFILFEKKELSCRPCSHLGYNQCPKGHFKCMNGITFDFYLP